MIFLSHMVEHENREAGPIRRQRLPSRHPTRRSNHSGSLYLLGTELSLANCLFLRGLRPQRPFYSAWLAFGNHMAGSEAQAGNLHDVLGWGTQVPKYPGTAEKGYDLTSRASSRVLSSHQHRAPSCLKNLTSRSEVAHQPITMLSEGCLQ